MKKVMHKILCYKKTEKPSQSTRFSRGCSTEHQGAVKSRRAEQNISRSISILIPNTKPKGSQCTLEFYDSDEPCCTEAV